MKTNIKTILLGAVFGIFAFTNFTLAKAPTSVWFYEWRDPDSLLKATKTIPSEKPGDKHWALTEFKKGPYPDDLKRLEKISNIQRMSVILRERIYAGQYKDFLNLSKIWKQNQIEGELKLMLNAPTKSDVGFYKQLCNDGMKIFFLTTTLYLPAELQAITQIHDAYPTCVRVDFSFARYLKHAETKELKQMPRVHFTMVNDYFPTYLHVDNFNLVSNPISLRIKHGLPSAETTELLATMKNLKGLWFEVDQMPSAKQYEELKDLSNKIKLESFSWRWTWGTPGPADFQAWKAANFSRIQVPIDVFNRPEAETALRNIENELIVETFTL